MSQTEPHSKSQTTQDLFQSLQRSIQRLRQEAEELQQRLADDGAKALNSALPRIAKLEGLIRDCQKVEKTLAEQNTQGATDQLGLDLAEARAEISRRLDRLRSSQGAEHLNRGDE